MYSPDNAHLRVLNSKPKLRFDKNKPFEPQQKAIRKKVLELLGHTPEKVPLNPIVEYKKEKETYTEYRIAFDTEEDVQAICRLCIPKLQKEKYPLVICVQGHTRGMHVSLGEHVYGDLDDPEGDEADYASQALEQGYAALCLDQRGMGERRTEMEQKDDKGQTRCHITSMNALLLGRTMIGERCWDISRAIDLALTFPEIDGDKIGLTGYSGGGTATYYGAIFDERIKIAMAVGAVCTFKSSISAMLHCTCNFVPKIAEYVDMGDMAAAIAPRKLIIVNGRRDGIFPDHGVRESYNIIRDVYESAGAPENCAHITGEGGHRCYKVPSWEAFNRLTGWKNP